MVGPSGGGKDHRLPVGRPVLGFGPGEDHRGGMDIAQVDPETLLSLYAIVFQDVTLFDNTILENIRIGRKDATDEEVLAAARLANCDEFAEKLPGGLAHPDWGERRPALRRGAAAGVHCQGLLKNAPILLLDEATASLDVDNETLIQTALSRLIQDRTVLVIAHRMRTVAGADKIVVLDGGVVAEAGSPKTCSARAESLPAWSASRPPARLGRFPGKAGKRPTPNLHARKERPDPVKGSGRSLGKRKGALLPSPCIGRYTGRKGIRRKCPMKPRIITGETLAAFRRHLQEAGAARPPWQNTCGRSRPLPGACARDSWSPRRRSWLGRRPWPSRRAPSTVNGKLAALNTFFQLPGLGGVPGETPPPPAGTLPGSGAGT